MSVIDSGGKYRELENFQQTNKNWESSFSHDVLQIFYSWGKNKYMISHHVAAEYPPPPTTPTINTHSPLANLLNPEQGPTLNTHRIILVYSGTHAVCGKLG